VERLHEFNERKRKGTQYFFLFFSLLMSYYSKNTRRRKKLKYSSKISFGYTYMWILNLMPCVWVGLGNIKVLFISQDFGISYDLLFF